VFVGTVGRQASEWRDATRNTICGMAVAAAVVTTGECVSLEVQTTARPFARTGQGRAGQGVGRVC
jgi:hypothetical protein